VSRAAYRSRPRPVWKSIGAVGPTSVTTDLSRAHGNIADFAFCLDLFIRWRRQSNRPACKPRRLDSSFRCVVRDVEA
jgi:hypothetical protein